KDTTAYPLLHSFPTRRSSDLPAAAATAAGNNRPRDESLLSPTRPAPEDNPRRSAYSGNNHAAPGGLPTHAEPPAAAVRQAVAPRSEEHTSELQSRGHLVCRLL